MQRDLNGRFPKGVSGNPRGRPKVGLSLAEQAREYGPEMLAILVKSARKGSITTVQAVLDRDYGRPHQSLDLRVLMAKKLSELTMEELTALEHHLGAIGGDDEAPPSTTDNASSRK
jgi:hypothetical protein